MQKMKNGLMMFCLTVLLSCAALMMNTPTASAMTLADLQGDYRIIVPKDSICPAGGCIVTLTMENGELVGYVKRATQNSGWDNGQLFMQNVYVHNGIAYCQALPGGSAYKDWYRDHQLDVYSNGRKLTLSVNDGKEIKMELHRM